MITIMAGRKEGAMGRPGRYVLEGMIFAASVQKRQERITLIPGGTGGALKNSLDQGDGGAGGSKKRLGRALGDQEEEYGDQRGIRPPVR